MNPIISFVIPVFNDEKNIGRCLRSIRHLHGPEDQYEVLILDNGSTDPTPQIIRELGFEFKVIPGVHVSALRNQGAAMARGTFLAFVDSDVELSPDWIPNGLAGFEDETVVATGCFPAIPVDATWVQKAWDVHQRGRLGKSEPQVIAWLPSMNLIVRRKVFELIGGFNEQLETAEDVDLCYRLGQFGKILCVPKMEAIHWGEAPDLATFWRKEVWRGIGNLRGVFSHGFRWDELPSLGYPLYVLFFLSLLGGGIVWNLDQGPGPFGSLCLFLLLTPAFILALNTSLVANRPASFPPLFFLYFLYGVSRAYAVCKASLREISCRGKRVSQSFLRV